MTTTDEPSDDDLDHAQVAWQAAADGGDGAAMSALGALLAMRGDLDAAETWLRRAVESGVDGALFNLGRVLECAVIMMRQLPPTAIAPRLAMPRL